ncbi:MAG TPA: hypothetical protein VFZ98_08185 [Vicinamibacterales bacterium]
MANALEGGTGDLQFDKVVPQGPPVPDALSCAYCKRPLPAEYYDVSGNSTCAGCRGQIETLIETPRGAGPFLKALTLGGVAGIAGAIVYYAVIAITNFEIGIVAILIGYMVGYAVRKGARGRGGRRFQVIGILLTYLAVGLAYTPLAVKGAIESRRKADASATATPERPMDPAAATRPSLIKILALVAGFIIALPVIVIVGGLPSSLLSAAIIFFGMRQAWRMTGTPQLQITGPYRVGAPPAPAA